MSSIDLTTKLGTSEPAKKSGSSEAFSCANSRPMISNAKFEVEKIDGTNNFGM